MLEPPYLELAFYVGARAANIAYECVATRMGFAVDRERKVTIPGLLGIAPDEELELVRETLLMRTAGATFCGPTSTHTRALRRRYGQLIYKAFVQFAEDVDCRYGAILVEYSLETPESLRRDSTSLAFQDFYIGKRWIGSALEGIIGLAGSESYVERLDRGTYISMCGDFNPDRREVPGTEAQRRSVAIAGILATIADKLMG